MEPRYLGCYAILNQPHHLWSSVKLRQERHGPFLQRCDHKLDPSDSATCRSLRSLRCTGTVKACPCGKPLSVQEVLDKVLVIGYTSANLCHCRSVPGKLSYAAFWPWQLPL